MKASSASRNETFSRTRVSSRWPEGRVDVDEAKRLEVHGQDPALDVEGWPIPRVTDAGTLRPLRTKVATPL